MAEDTNRQTDEDDGGIQGDATGRTRSYDGWAATAISAFCVLVAVVHLYFALFPLPLDFEFLDYLPVPSELERNAFHFAGFALLCAVLYPPFSAEWAEKSRAMIVFDWVLGIAAFVAAMHLAFAESDIYDRGVRLAPQDWIAGFVVIVAAIELSRRAAGIVIPILIVLSLTYVVEWGQWIGGVFAFPGLSYETALFRSIYGDDALFGKIARISSTYVFLFIIFGAFLIRSGAGDFVIDLARAVAGKLVGGPGLVSVVASGLTGTISGSAIANTASTGVITIPLMQKAGFRPQFAAGVEAAASTGGQLMPPIMGAGAFVMASFTQISYEYIIIVAALPALLYFLSVAFFVRIEAKRLNLQPMDQDDRTLWDAVKEGGASFILPITLVIALLVWGFTPTYAAVLGILAVIASSWLTKRRMGPREVWQALEMGTRNMVTSAVLLCAVGLVVNVIATAGVGNTFSLMISEWSNGILLVAIALIGLASLVLGMGLPVTAAYIVLATLSAPALSGLIQDVAVVEAIVSGGLPEGVKPILMLADPSIAEKLTGEITRGQASSIVAELPLAVSEQLRNQVVSKEAATTALLSAHMIVFWLSQDSNVTPPVCLAAFTAAAIAKSPPMWTGVQSWKLAKGLYIVPVLFAYTPLLSGDWGQAFIVFAFAVFGIYGMAAGFQGCMERRLNVVLRAAAFAAGVACVWPFSLIVNLIGVAGVVGLFIYNQRFGPEPAAAAA